MEALLRQAFELRAKGFRLAVRPDQLELLNWYTRLGFVHEATAANPQTLVLCKKLEVTS